jgi:hypothetical protein
MTYKFKGTKGGKKVSGTIEATSLKLACQRVKTNGITVMAIDPVMVETDPLRDWFVKSKKQWRTQVSKLRKQWRTQVSKRRKQLTNWKTISENMEREQRCVKMLDKKSVSNKESQIVNNHIICSNVNCGYKGEAKKSSKGSILIALFLLCLFIIPGVLYLIFCSGSRYYCPKCSLRVSIIPTGETNSILLGIGVFIFPFIFAWFTLKKGYSDRFRAVAFGWLIFCFLLSGISQSDSVVNYREKRLISAMDYLKDMPRVSWFEVDDNDVYIGLSKGTTLEIEFTMESAALIGNKVTNFGVHVWGVPASNSRGWRPGDGPYYGCVTGRYGKVNW